MKPRSSALVALAVIVGACGGDSSNGGTGPPVDRTNPGFVSVRLATPNADDGAVLLTLSGGVADSLAASVGEMFFTQTGTNTFRIIVAGPLANGTIARFWMPDRRNVAQYLATLEQAAVRGTYEQQDIAGYSLTISP